MQTPVAGVSVDERDNGHHSDNEVDALLWCLQHFRHEVGGTIGCDGGTASAEQGSGQAAGDGPLLPAVG